MSDEIDQQNGVGGEPGAAMDVVSDVWHRRRGLILAMFSAVLVAAIIAAVSLPNVYRATAKVIVDRQEVSEVFVQPSVTDDLETRIQTIDQRVRGRDSLAAVIVEKDLYPNLRKVAPMDSVVDRMRQDFALRLEGVGDENGRRATVAFTVTYRGRDPVVVADVANALAGLYVAENTRSRKQQAIVTADFLAKEVERARREMDVQERRASDFTNVNSDVLPQQLEVNLAALDRVSTELRQNGDYQLRAIERRERLEKELAESALSGTSNSEEAVTARAERLRGELAQLRRRFSDKHPDVIRLTAEIAALDERIASAQPGSDYANITRGSVSRALVDVNEQLQTLKEEETKLRRLSASYETRIESAPKRRTEVDRLSRGNTSIRERYEALLKRYDAARLATNLEVSQDLEQFRILDPAVPPRLPAMPNRLWILGMGLLGALAAAAAAVVGAEKLDSTFHSPGALRSFVGVPLLATIRTVPTRRAERRRRMRAALRLIATAAALALIAAASYYLTAGNEDLVRLISRGGA